MLKNEFFLRKNKKISLPIKNIQEIEIKKVSNLINKFYNQPSE